MPFKPSASFLVVSAFLLTVLVTISSCESFGTAPDKSHQNQFLLSNNYDRVAGQFVNRRQAELDDAEKQSMPWGLLVDFVFDTGKASPDLAATQVVPDFDAFLEGDHPLKVIWFGHSSFLLNIDGTIVLVDPVFGNAGPLPFLVSRFHEAVVEAEDLPPLDYILISHDHYDHLESGTMKYFADKDVTFVVPLGLSAHLASWGVDTEKVVERDWWEAATFANIEFTAAPSQHFSGRSGVKRNYTLWASWIIKSETHKVFFSGDSGYDTHFAEIGKRFGPFEVAFIENGQYSKYWPDVHLMPEEGIRAFQELKAEKYFPIHWGMFNLAPHEWNEPIIRTSALAQQHNIDVLAPRIGQVTNIEDQVPDDPWWLE